ncbi:threonine-phosphate decarboxylase [Balneicella halophila]|uniref:Threonine-phosphate decarboxylase n=1 Tax=Balneicella halophila TaxID=1537566 RepID=A0A7L4UQ06_BALHA|nr:aminotransferase class I/II-fold pyridoxal phosphate-dependent enzyme [Balneicella halophila]PVX50682.1 threonine-phosphate decarboxylase [Balneicella halophila]
MIYGHGDDIYSQNQQIVYNFSSNVYEHEDDNWLYNLLEKNLSVLHSYPEPDATSLVQLLAHRNNISEEEICATHGATDAIYLIAQTFSHSNTAIFAPTFSEYEDACRINRHRITIIKELEDVNRKNFEMVWLCNPNNPTGLTFDYNILVELIDNNPETLFIIDQTYHYFTNKPTLSYVDAVKRENVVLIDSFTKRFALPDLRLGYFVTNKKLKNKIQYYKQPWAVSQLAIEVGKYILQSMTCNLDLASLLGETKDFQERLSNIKGIEVQGTDTHFFLCKTQKGTAEELKKYLVEHHGILIRNASNFEGLTANYFRICTQKKEANMKLIDGITDYMNSFKA